MATFRGDIHKLFPLKSTGDVVKLFRQHLDNTNEPDLALLSIVTGIIENTLTSKCVVPQQESSTNVNPATSPTTTTSTTITAAANQQTSGGTAAAAAASQTAPTTGTPTTNTTTTTPPTTTNHTKERFSNFPIVHFDTVIELYDKFKKILSIVESNKINKSTATKQYATRELIKKVSDIIWNSLIRSTYKDRAHLQSLYSYLAGSKLDCFGVAFAVVAGCQLLGYTDVHLAISEDHAWVVFGKTGMDTIEVTWHGKGAEDKRGQPVTEGYESQSWLYLSGNPVVCDRYMEVAAIISSINPSLNMTSACLEVADLQQQLLWLMYDLGHLEKYPMGLGCLGELEEVSPTIDRLSCEDLYAASVKSSKTFYKNHHVYPYTYQGGYYYRQIMYKHAFSAWANAGDVIRLYNYSRDDEEIYKEFLDIANELIPLVMKTESSGHSAKSVLRDPHCFANLLRFYDGICQWEEGSQTPILHIGWAKPLVTTISRFDCDIRSQVIINCARDDDDGHKMTEGTESNNNVMTMIGSVSATTTTIDEKSNNNKEAVISSLEALTAACGEKILNPDFLLQGGGQPFAEQQQQHQKKIELEKPCNKDAELTVIDKMKVEDGQASVISTVVATPDSVHARPAPKYEPPADIVEPKRPEITLYSRKMKGIKDLLLAEKLNTHAISLQVTAQSQVQVGGKKGRSMTTHAINYAKRCRRQ